MSLIFVDTTGDPLVDAIVGTGGRSEKDHYISVTPQRLAEIHAHQLDIAMHTSDPQFLTGIVGFEHYTASFGPGEIAQFSQVLGEYEQIQLQNAGFSSIYDAAESNPQLYGELSSNRLGHQIFLETYLQAKRIEAPSITDLLANPEPSFADLNLLELVVAQQLGTYVPQVETPNRHAVEVFSPKNVPEMALSTAGEIIVAMRAVNLSQNEPTVEDKWPYELIELAKAERLQALGQFSALLIAIPSLNIDDLENALPGIDYSTIEGRDRIEDRRARWNHVLIQANALEIEQRYLGQMSETYSHPILGQLQRAYDLWQIWSDAQVGVDRAATLFANVWQHSSIDQAGQTQLTKLARKVMAGESGLPGILEQSTSRACLVRVNPNPTKVRHDHIYTRSRIPGKAIQTRGIPGAIVALEDGNYQLIGQEFIFGSYGQNDNLQIAGVPITGVPNLLATYLRIRQAELGVFSANNLERNILGRAELLPGAISDGNLTLSAVARETIGKFTGGLIDFVSSNRKRFNKKSLPEYAFVPNNGRPNIMPWNIATSLE